MAEGEPKKPEPGACPGFVLFIAPPLWLLLLPNIPPEGNAAVGALENDEGAGALATDVKAFVPEGAENKDAEFGVDGLPNTEEPLGPKSEEAVGAGSLVPNSPPVPGVAGLVLNTPDVDGVVVNNPPDLGAGVFFMSAKSERGAGAEVETGAEDPETRGVPVLVEEEEGVRPSVVVDCRLPAVAVLSVSMLGIGAGLWLGPRLKTRPVPPIAIPFLLDAENEGKPLGWNALHAACPLWSLVSWTCSSSLSCLTGRDSAATFSTSSSVMLGTMSGSRMVGRWRRRQFSSPRTTTLSMKMSSDLCKTDLSAVHSKDQISPGKTHVIIIGHALNDFVCSKITRRGCL